MWSIFQRSIMIAGALLIFQACGEKPVDVQPREQVQAQAEKTITDLQSKLTKAKQDAAALRRENTELEGRVKALSKESSKEETVRGDKKIELLGAKALAEYQVDQLNKRLDKLTKNLDSKEKELGAIRQTSDQRQNEIEELKTTIEKLQTEDKKRITDLTSKLDKMSKDLAQDSAESQELKRQLDERDQLLATLKNAVADATKLKAQAEAEGNRLRSELAEATKKLESTEAAREQDRQTIGELQAEEEETRQQAVQYREAAEQCKLETDRLEKETGKLQAEISDLSSRLRAAQPPEENQPSIIDKLLEEPKADNPSGEPSALR
jgi:chromosome segregation ATPase